LGLALPLRTASGERGRCSINNNINRETSEYSTLNRKRRLII